MKHIILILVLFIFSSANAQKKLQKLYEKGEYIKCIQKAEKYISKKKHLSISRLYKVRSLVKISNSDKENDYRYPIAEAVKALYYLRKKDSLFFSQEQQVINPLIAHAAGMADSLKKLGTPKGYRHANKVYRYLNKAFPEIAEYYFGIAECKQNTESDFRPSSFFEDNEITKHLLDTVQQQKAVAMANKFGHTAFQDKNFESAADYYDLVCQFLPDKPKAYYLKADCYFKLDQQDNFDAEMYAIWNLIDNAPDSVVPNMYITYTNFMYNRMQHQKLFDKIVLVKDTLSVDNAGLKQWRVTRLQGTKDTIKYTLTHTNGEATSTKKHNEIAKKRAQPISALQAIDEQNALILLQILKSLVVDYKPEDDIFLLYDMIEFKERYYSNFPDFDRELKKVTDECSFHCGFTEAEKREMLNEVNKRRSKRTACGDKVMPAVSPLVWDDCVAAAAQFHADDMVKHNFFSHTSPNGEIPSNRGSEFGCDNLGENIARGQMSIRTVVDSWMNSPGHCRNIMSKNYTKFGAGRSENRWVQNFK